MSGYRIETVCVFSGSSRGKRPDYAAAAGELGKILAADNISLVYGGGNVGLMGVLADAVLDAGGRVTGVIPGFLFDREVAHDRLTELKVVDTMHERKAVMSGLADAFIALPGGLGTLEELLEVLTWQQLGVQSKPCAVLNTGNYFAGLMQQLERAVEEKFLKAAHRDMLLKADTPVEVMDLLAGYAHHHIDKWIDSTAGKKI